MEVPIEKAFDLGSPNHHGDANEGKADKSGDKKVGDEGEDAQLKDPGGEGENF